MSYAFGSLTDGQRASDSEMQDESALPEGVTDGEVDPTGPLSYRETREGMRNAWTETFAGTDYAREQGGWVVRPEGIRGFFRSLLGLPEVYVNRAPSGTRTSINLGPRPRHAIGKFHTHPGGTDIPLGSEADLHNRVPAYVIGRGGVSRINSDNSQSFLGTRDFVLGP